MLGQRGMFPVLESEAMEWLMWEMDEFTRGTPDFVAYRKTCIIET